MLRAPFRGLRVFTYSTHSTCNVISHQMPTILITVLANHPFLWMCDVHSLLPGPCAVGNSEGESVFYIIQEMGLRLRIYQGHEDDIYFGNMLIFRM
jgi:hypothetical protein